MRQVNCAIRTEFDTQGVGLVSLKYSQCLTHWSTAQHINCRSPIPRAGKYELIKAKDTEGINK